MNQLHRAIERREADARYFVAPTQHSHNQITRWIVDAAVELRDMLNRHQNAAAEALAAEIESYQEAAAKIVTSPAYVPPAPPAGSEAWRLTINCWAEGLIHGPLRPRTFYMHEGATEAQALGRAREIYAQRFGGFAVERAAR